MEFLYKSWVDLSSWSHRQVYRFTCKPESRFQALHDNKKMCHRIFGVYPNEKLHIDINPIAKLVQAQPYPVSCVHLHTFKTELVTLWNSEYLPINNKMMALSTVIFPKMDGRTHWMSDLWELNTVIQCIKYLSLIITNIYSKKVLRLSFTLIFIWAYKFELNKESQKLYTINIPLGR